MESGFQSRSLHTQSQQEPLHIQRPLPPPPRRVRPPRGGRGGITMRDRVIALHAWARARGRRRLIKDTILAGGGLIILYFLFLWITLPDISDARKLLPNLSSVIVDRNNVELYRLYEEENRTIIPADDIPDHMKKAIVAIEDERFYERGCLDIQAIARVFYRFGQAGGASTLTRQLARNALDLKGDNLINRKLKEVILGCQLEAEYEKDELLGLYLNWIPFGQNAYGIELASRTYFNKSAKELTLAESAIMAALPQAPSYYSPYGQHVRTTVTPGAVERIVNESITETSDFRDEEFQIGLMGDYVGTGATFVYIGGRTDQVLRNMQNLGYIKEEERVAALKTLETIEFKQSRENIRAPHFVLWVKSQVEELLSDGAETGIISQGGLTIETTLDWEMQQIAESLIAAKHPGIASTYGANNAAMISVETGTNRILTYVGNADYNDEEHDGKVDMARAPRQPGSSFKPFVYTTMFEKGYAPASVLYDVPTKIGQEQPQNFDGGFWGLMNVRRALGASRNIPAIKAYFIAGEEDEILELVTRLGVTTPSRLREEYRETNPDFNYGWPLALGAAETPLLEMVQGYATIANGGVYKPLVSISRIKDRRGNILYESDVSDDGTQAIDPRIAYQITSVLSDAGARPGEYWANVLSVPGIQTAAKTGTSNKCLKRDDNGNCTDRKPDNMWTMGFTPNIVTGIWMGNANAEALSPKAESLNLVSPIWKDYMVRANKLVENPKTSFAQPSGLVQPQISTLSGQLPTECTPVAYRKADIFLSDRAPTEADPACIRLTVDRVTGLLASPECPAEAAEERSFFNPQELLSDRFPQWQESVRAWARGAGGSGGNMPLPLAPIEKCSLSLTPGRTQKPTMSIEFPSNGGGASYPSFQVQLDYSVGSKVQEIRVELDGKQAARTNDAENIVVQVPRSVKESGTHTLKVTLTDEYFNEVTDTVSFRFEEDNNGPSVRFLSPQGNFTAAAGEQIVLSADAEDGEGGIKYVQFYVDDTLLSTKPNAPYRLEWTNELEPGNYELRAIATDLAGNEEEDSIDLTIE
jgi:membrane peptidoglycan carboxypeptidase